MKNAVLKRCTAGTLAVGLLLAAPLSAGAVDRRGKEEVIYASLSSSGAVQEVNVVNIFDLSAPASLTDYGSYTSIRNMTSQDALVLNNGCVTGSVGAGRLYYEGHLEQAELPWLVSVRYLLDGKECAPEALSGGTGKLSILLSIQENPACTGSFFSDYSLQVSLSLDTKHCQQIRAEGATTANVGSKKQLTYTVFPNKGLETEITAQVEDFSMEGISINGIRLNFNIEVDDSLLTERVSELLEAIGKLDDGASQLANGAEQLDTGSGALTDGASKLENGIDTLADGANTLAAGGETLNHGLAQLQTGADTLKDGSSSLFDGSLELKNGSSTLAEGAVTLDQGIAELLAGLETAQAGLELLDSRSAELTAGSGQVYQALELIRDSLSGLSADTSQLARLTEAADQLQEGISKLRSGAEQLSNAVGYQQYKDLMLEQGLDLDQLHSGNDQGIQTLTALLQELQQVEETLKKYHVGDRVLNPLNEKIQTQINDLTLLLQGSNANLMGIEAYLNALSNNTQTLADGLAELDEQYGLFYEAIGTLVDTLEGTMTSLLQLSEGINQLTEQYETLDHGINEYTEGMAQLAAGFQKLVDGGRTLAEGSSTLTNGSKTLANGASALYDGAGLVKDGAFTLSDGTDQLYNGSGELLAGLHTLSNGSGTLKDGAHTLWKGTRDLADGITELRDGTIQLSDGTAEMREQTDGMEDQISEKIDELLDSFRGGNGDVVSFASPRNQDVAAVQFVLKTAPIAEAEQAAQEDAPQDQLNFFQKLLRLFGLY